MKKRFSELMGQPILRGRKGVSSLRRGTRMTQVAVDTTAHSVITFRPLRLFVQTDQLIASPLENLS
jgi:hypothetical protein